MMIFVLDTGILFAVGSLVSWILEFVSQKRWVIPGFLSGPYSPLYGVRSLAFIRRSQACGLRDIIEKEVSLLRSDDLHRRGFIMMKQIIRKVKHTDEQ